MPRTTNSQSAPAAASIVGFSVLSRGDRRLIERSGLFDAPWYLQHAPEAAASGLDPLDHYVSIGWKTGRSPGPLFDAAWYRSFYNDVDAAGYEPLLHFIHYGQREGRDMRGAYGSIFDAFQSLGESCEFGFVQQHFGSQTLGLFRFASTTADGLIAAFEHGLARAICPATLEVTAGDGEYHVAVPAYGMRFHTTVLTHAMTADAVKAHETRRLEFLVRKFGEDLEDADKIFVYTSFDRPPPAKMKRLAACLRRHGCNRLMVVTRASNARQCGAFRLIAEGLAVAHVDQLGGGPSASTLKVWSAICGKAYALWCRSGEATVETKPREPAKRGRK